MSGHPLTLTGERTLPGIDRENYWFRRHERAYRHVAETVADAGWRRLLDAGCGEGYGAAILSRTGARVVAVDLDAPTVGHVARAYPEVLAVRANLVALPIAAATCDAVVSCQVIEHQWDVGAYLDEVARVLRPGGTFVCTTPNRLTFTPGSPEPVNPFHTVEFTASEITACLASRFEAVTVEGVWHAARLTEFEARSGVPLPTRLQAPAWPDWLAALVAGVTVDDFVVAGPAPDPDALADSLDLVATGLRP